MDQKNKNLSLLISLGTLLLLSVFLLVSGNQSVAPADPTLFRLADPKSIDRVVIEKPNSKIELQYKPGGWKVNDSLSADGNLIDVLFATVEQAVPKRAVASRIRDSVVSLLNTSGIKVSFYSGSEVDKQFLVWGDANSGLTYFSDVAPAQPYVIVIPGYRVQVSGVFEQSAIMWRDKRIFNFNWRNFKELRAQFPRDQKQNFNVAMTGRYFSIVNEINIDTTELNNYLDAVSLIYADQFYELGESARVDSLIHTTPIMRIAVGDVSGKIYSLELFEIPPGHRNAIGRWGSDYVWFDRRNILPIYKKKKDFVK